VRTLLFLLALSAATQGALAQGYTLEQIQAQRLEAGEREFKKAMSSSDLKPLRWLVSLKQPASSKAIASTVQATGASLTSLHMVIGNAQSMIDLEPNSSVDSVVKQAEQIAGGGLASAVRDSARRSTGKTRDDEKKLIEAASSSDQKFDGFEVTGPPQAVKALRNTTLNVRLIEPLPGSGRPFAIPAERK
jgi:hypothetical protein